MFRQTNIEKRRVYNLPQWREVCESTDHQPPARRGEVRMAGHTVGKRKAKVTPKKAARKKTKLSETKSAPTPPQSTWIAYNPSEKISLSQQAKQCFICNATPEVPAWINQNTGDILCNACDINRVTTTTDDIQHVHSENRLTDEIARIPSAEQSFTDKHPTQIADNERSTSPEPFDATVRPMEIDQPITEPTHRIPVATNFKTKTGVIDRIQHGGRRRRV